nr:pyridoxal-phosphate dependent enzyme [Desulfobacterales bacterium]
MDLRTGSHGETFLETILERIGNTPLVRIRNLAREYPGVDILAKAEWFNPGGSVKDRAAIRMIEDGERSGRLTKNKVILDSSSGNMAVSYSMIGAAKGYQVEMVVPGTISQSHLATITAFGTKVIFSDPLEGSDGAIRLAHSIFEEHPGRYFMP